MKLLLFINENYQLNQKELDKFINYLSMNEMLEEYIPLIAKKVNLNELLLYIDQRYIIKEKGNIIYKNLFTNEIVNFYQKDNKILLKGINENSGLMYTFFKISKHYVLIDY